MPQTSTIIEPQLISGEELWEMGDIGPCELIEGRIVMTSPTNAEHGFIEVNIVHALKSYIKRKKLGWVLTGEVGVYTRRNPDTVRGADMAFISKERLLGRPHKKYIEVSPELVVEIFPPTESRKNIRDKVREYLSIGAEQVWVVDPGSRTVAVNRPGLEAQTLSIEDILKGEGVLEGFKMKVRDIFEA